MGQMTPASLIRLSLEDTEILAQMTCATTWNQLLHMMYGFLQFFIPLTSDTRQFNKSSMFPELEKLKNHVLCHSSSEQFYLNGLINDRNFTHVLQVIIPDAASLPANLK